MDVAAAVHDDPGEELVRVIADDVVVDPDGVAPCVPLVIGEGEKHVRVAVALVGPDHVDAAAAGAAAAIRGAGGDLRIAEAAVEGVAGLNDVAADHPVGAEPGVAAVEGPLEPDRVREVPPGDVDLPVGSDGGNRAVVRSDVVGDLCPGGEGGPVVGALREEDGLPVRHVILPHDIDAVVGRVHGDIRLVSSVVEPDRIREGRPSIHRLRDEDPVRRPGIGEDPHVEVPLAVRGHSGVSRGLVRRKVAEVHPAALPGLASVPRPAVADDGVLARVDSEVVVPGAHDVQRVGRVHGHRGLVLGPARAVLVHPLIRTRKGSRCRASLGRAGDLALLDLGRDVPGCLRPRQCLGADRDQK